ncbi:DMP19 family protein [Lignipirellula cremea]|uniref:DNA mimic protein DMP19 C-terminal domain-containing protein n=1 Tax=Lignipirellula cremea TaxID=2528010 RepID=A0A518DPY9_9BACT|nr:hypothetical protein [Lignipirellula cremea]QDU93905.1 hypothetical protein Pla8534_16900 [Lignipirellula cremea]
MDVSQQLARYYDSLIERCNRDPSARPNNLPKHDQIIYYVISTRCEMDMNGFDSVFDQLLTENELRLLVDALNELGAGTLAESFNQAHSRLRDAGFFGDDSMMVSDLDNDDFGFLDDIEDDIRKNDSLWDLDDRLAELIPTNAK